MIDISNIQRFATHDGPGIRTTIFFKGCSLHCPWCANPETWSRFPVLMHDTKKCIRCLNCQYHCRHRAICFDPDFIWNPNLCTYCNLCVENCLNEALEFSGKKMEIEEILHIVMKDKDYYDNSSGGITISGGEPFIQYEELLALLRSLKEKELHVAIETTGNYPIEYLKNALEYVDLWLYDLKHIDKAKLEIVTGGNYDRIMDNLIYLMNEIPEQIIVRTPVIPGFNDSRDDLNKMIQFAASYSIREMNLLPYHSLGKSKWKKMHKKYAYENLRMMDKSELKEYIETGQKYGIKIKLGG